MPRRWRDNIKRRSGLLPHESYGGSYGTPAPYVPLNSSSNDVFGSYYSGTTPADSKGTTPVYGGGISTDKADSIQKTIDELTALNTGTLTSTSSPTPTPTTTTSARNIEQELLDENLQKKYGGGMSAAELQDFETLIGRLEGSKMRQAAQLNRARQRERYSGGLASMMRNF